MSEAGEPPIRREAIAAEAGCFSISAASGLMFTEEARDFYKLEHLWSDAEEIDLSSFIGPAKHLDKNIKL